MRIARYQGKSYNAKVVKEGVEIFVKGKENGFHHKKGYSDIISYKIVQESELDEIYTVDYSVIWKGHEFEPMYGVKKCELMLYTTKYDVFTCENNFTEIDRGELYKIVPIEECENFKMTKILYENGKKSGVQIRFLTADEFIESYCENVIRLH